MGTASRAMGTASANLHPLLGGFLFGGSAGRACPLALDFPGSGSPVRTSLRGTRVSCAHSCRLAFGWMLRLAPSPLASSLARPRSFGRCSSTRTEESRPTFNVVRARSHGEYAALRALVARAGQNRSCAPAHIRLKTIGAFFRLIGREADQ